MEDRLCIYVYRLIHRYHISIIPGVIEVRLYFCRSGILSLGFVEQLQKGCEARGSGRSSKSKL